MRYLCLRVATHDELDAVLEETAALDWRLHTLTFLPATEHVGASWHLVMEKGI